MAEPIVPVPETPVVAATPATEPVVPASTAGTETAALASVAALPAADAASPLASERPSLLETFIKDGAAEAAAAKAKEEPAKPEGEVKPAEPVKAAEAKPAEEPVKPAVDAKPPEPVKAPEPVVPPPAPEPVKYEFALPEGLRADEKKIDAFSALLNEAHLPAELGKVVGEKLLGLHNEAAKEYSDFVAREQHRVFNETRDGWNKDVLAHPEIGGAGHVTAMRKIARVRDAVISSAPVGTAEYLADVAAYEDFLRITGAGDHPAHLAMMYRMDKFIGEPQADEMPTNIRPTPQNGARPGNFKQVMYDNPRSTQNGRP